MKRQAIPLRKFIHYKNSVIQKFHYLCFQIKQDEKSGNEDSHVALERWYDVVDKASWRNFSEIKVDFPATDYVGNQHYGFNKQGTI